MRGWTRIVVVALAALVVAGCSGGGDAKKPSAKLPSDTQRATTSAPATSPPSPSSSAPSPTASAPSPPALIAQDTPAGAKATAEYLIRVIDATYARSETRQFKRLRDPGCHFCRNVISEIDDLNAGGHPIALETRWIIHRVSKYKFTPAEASFIADVTSGQTRYYDEKSKREKLGDRGHRVRLLVTLDWEGDSWRVAEVNRVAD